MAARPLRIAILAIVAFAVGLLLARLLVPAKPALPATERATVLAPARELPPLSLTDIDGRPLGSDFFAGHWTVVFFGFTTCPDVCPTTLATLAQFTKALTDLPEAQRPRVLLVTVDPERDDPAKLAAYVRFFDPSFLGATGDLAGVTAAAMAFGVPFAKVSLPEGGYTMDHGSGLFIVGPGGGIDAYSSSPHEAAVLARDFRKVVSYVEGRK
jgi:protein SCO1/2